MSKGKRSKKQLSRGARRRREEAHNKARRQVLDWWTQPSVLLFAAVLALALVGAGIVVRDIVHIPVRAATLDGLSMEMIEARWLLDQMDHGENFQKPSTMMPDMPEWGKQRVSLDLMFYNESESVQEFRAEEFFMVPELGSEVPPMGAQTAHAKLQPGQSLNTVIHFDFDTTEPHGKLRVAWRRGGDSVFLPIPEPAEHYHLRPRGGEIALPADVRLVMPLGKSELGRGYYIETFGCVACHGDPKVPGSNIIGPHLGNIGLAAASRQEGKSAAQYIYESILEPNAFIAPECEQGRPCTAPSHMPEYAALMEVEQVAHLVAYLLEQTADSPAGPSAGEQ
ncbi:MAG TPA: hypothetical protein VLV83_08770 [Acidobacteriota bacterium]|nr:hypothetical protein [Acidobacteriota bacterium]